MAQRRAARWRRTAEQGFLESYTFNARIPAHSTCSYPVAFAECSRRTVIQRLALDVTPRMMSSEVSPPDPASQPDAHNGRKTRRDRYQRFCGTELTWRAPILPAQARDALQQPRRGDDF